jgi:hypothetical protein
MTLLVISADHYQLAGTAIPNLIAILTVFGRIAEGGFPFLWGSHRISTKVGLCLFVPARVNSLFPTATSALGCAESLRSLALDAFCPCLAHIGRYGLRCFSVPAKMHHISISGWMGIYSFCLKSTAGSRSEAQFAPWRSVRA